MSANMTNNEPYYDLTVLWRFKNNNQKDKTLIFNINMLFSKQCDYDQLVLIVSAVSHEQHHFVPERVMYDSGMYSAETVTFNPQRGAVIVKTAISSGRRTQSSPVNLGFASGTPATSKWASWAVSIQEWTEPQPSVRSHPEQTQPAYFISLSGWRWRIKTTKLICF